MKNLNIGVANLNVSNVLKESYLNGEIMSESKTSASKLLDVVSNSPILQLEFKVFDRIENKKNVKGALAPRYIDNNIKLFECYTLEEVIAENEKLKPFISESVVENDKVNLYNSIQVLINESLMLHDEIDVDLVHESFSTVLNHIESNESTNTEINESYDGINEEVIEIAVEKFNEKYQKMTEEEVNLFKKLVTSTDEEKQSLFEDYKKDNISLLNAINEENTNDKISKSIDKINQMEYNSKDVDTNIISLFELKQGLK